MSLHARSFIKSCQESYYEGEPLISNEEYDNLVRRFPEDEEHIGAAGDIPHMYRLYSLQKFYLSRGDKEPNLKDKIYSPKLDGSAVAYLFVDGVLVSAITRGDGISGKDKTANLKQLLKFNNINGLVEKIPKIMQVRGEVVPLASDISNIRNYGSGKVNLKDPLEFAVAIEEGKLEFVAYGVTSSTHRDGVLDTYEEDMKLLSSLGFTTCLDVEIQMMANSGELLTDGVVVRENNNEEYSSLGFTAKFPRGAYAIKEDDEGEITTLREVIWQVGTSGKVTPVGVFDTVIIGDAEVSRATLNNQAYIRLLDLELNCKIRVIRAGDVIPKIVERIYE